MAFFLPNADQLALTGTASFFAEKNTVDGRNTDYKNAKAICYKKTT
jgi:hypothetical protein